MLIFPAVTPAKDTGGQVYFLFSLSQVEDILKETKVCAVPFSPPHIEGVAEWRDRVVPVIDIEKCLGLDPGSEGVPRRLIMVRTGPAVSKTGETRAMLKASSAIRMMSLPIPSTPLTSATWIPKKYLVRGAYRWEKGFLVIVHLEKILRGRG